MTNDDLCYRIVNVIGEVLLLKESLDRQLCTSQRISLDFRFGSPDSHSYTPTLPPQSQISSFPGLPAPRCPFFPLIESQSNA